MYLFQYSHQHFWPCVCWYGTTDPGQHLCSGTLKFYVNNELTNEICIFIQEILKTLGWADPLMSYHLGQWLSFTLVHDQKLLELMVWHSGLSVEHFLLFVKYWTNYSILFYLLDKWIAYRLSDTFIQICSELFAAQFMFK